MGKPKLILVKYRNYTYGKYTPKVEEVPAHFDARPVTPKMAYSLHTEYSYSKRKFTNPIFNQLKVLKEASYRGIPLLWASKEWAEQFFQFVDAFIYSTKPPEVIEIHPPYVNYSTIDKFLKIYSTFEKLMVEKYKNTVIAIENRSGSEYRKNFLISKPADIGILTKKVKEAELNLKIMLDIPQLFTSLGGIGKLSMESIKTEFMKFERYKDLIAGIHLYGRDRRAHLGNLDSLFGYDVEFKNEFLEFISEFFNDGVSRYFVPEVNNGKGYLLSVLDDVNKYFDFI